MSGSFQQKEVIRYSLLIAFAITALLLIFHSTFRIPAHNIVLFALLVGGRFFIVSLINPIVRAFALRHLATPTPFQKKVLLYLALNLCAALLFTCTDFLEFSVLFFPGHYAFRWGTILLETIMNTSIVVIVQSFVLLRLDKAKIEIENAQLRAVNQESVNLLLKQQIQPHFLFNALSMMKSLYKTDIHAGEAYLTHLVNFLRASLTSSTTGTCRLADEIKLCQDYLEMQQVRFQDGLRCEIDIPETVLQKGTLPSFAIQSLIENAIKHNEVSSVDPLVVKVYYTDGRIVTENNFQPKRQPAHPSGKGLANLVERYKILSGDTVIIKQDSHSFCVSIKVLNHENSHHRG